MNIQAKRAAVMIGVAKTGILPELQAAVGCAKRMGEWALEQGFPKKLVKVITDENGPVTGGQISKTIKAILQQDGIEQIMVYFSGHGINKGSEYWLLSGAPDDPNEAVNLDGSANLARYVGVPHVVFISDACRTAADGIQFQRVTGCEIFPNRDPAPEQPVDIFFACRLGSPSLEVKDRAGSFKAVFTEAMLVALQGKRTEVIEGIVDGDATVGVVRPRPLGNYLASEVPKRLVGVKTETGPVSQVPYARLTSDNEAWLACFVERGERTVRGGHRSVRTEPSIQAPENVQAVAGDVLRSALAGNISEVGTRMSQAAANNIEGASLLARAVAQIEPAFGPAHFESNCGFKVRGNGLTGAHVAGGAQATIFPDSRQAVRIDGLQGPAASVLLTFENGVGVVLPAISGFIGALEFEGGELLSASYEPSEHSWRWPAYADKRAEFRTLRSVIAASARLGVFRLHGTDAESLARQMQMSKNADPAMAVYAAYAYHEMRLTQQLQEMHGYQNADLGMCLFDVAFLARALDNGKNNLLPNVFPAFPLLAQGWALLPAFGIKLPERLSEIRSHLVPSIWSVFDAGGVAILRTAITSGEVI